MEKDEKRTWVIARTILAIVFLAFLLWGFIIKPEHVEETLWAKLHPMSVLNVIGVVFFLITILALAGLPQKLVEKYAWAPAGSAAPNYILFAIAALGIIFIWI